MSTHLERSFETPEPVELYVENGRGRVDVTATATTQARVRITGERAEEFDVRDLDDGSGRRRIAVLAPARSGGFLGRDPRADVVVEVPVASALSVKVGSSDVHARGRFDDTRIETGSGDVSLDVVDGATIIQSGSGDLRADHLVGDARIKTGSGDIVVGSAESSLVVSTGSGDIRVDAAGDGLAIKTGSGDASIGSLAGEAVFTAGSGDLQVAEVGAGRLTVKTASGDVRIGIVPSTPVWTDIRTLSGRLTSTLPSTGEPAADQPYLEVRATTASGDVTLHQS